jgi:tetratricopeptide (TPR) repeat protein
VAKQKKNQQVRVEPQPTQSVSNIVRTYPKYLPYVIIFLFSCLIYGNTYRNLFAIDDVIVLTDNVYTKKGAQGVKEIMTHDMFEGFFGERGAMLVSGGRYRPLSMVTLALEYEVMRKIRGDKRDVIDSKNVIVGSANDPYLNPMLSHIINILLFALTGVILYHLLVLIIPVAKNTPFYFSIPFLATMLYAAHPLHTEAVANIKGRDEVMCMLFSLLALFAVVKYVKTENIVHLIWGTLIYFVALLSKENAVTFFAVVPLTLFFFTKAQPKHYLLSVGAYAAAFAFFLFLRHQYTKAGLTQDSPEILNNPFAYATSAQRYATAIFTFLYYYWLQIFPHPLTHDYYYNQIPLVDFADIKFVGSFIVTAGLVVYALINIKKKTIPAYAILFYFITFSVVTNIFFTVGVLMNERFIYMSSLGFCILLAYLLVTYLKNEKLKIATISAVLLLYSVKTFTRNFDWHDSTLLFMRDVRWSPNSSKIQTSLGGDLTKVAESNISLLRDSGELKNILADISPEKSSAEIMSLVQQPDSIIRNIILDSSIVHLNEAIRVYPTHSNAWLLLGNAVYKRNHKPDEVIPIYEKAAQYRVGGYYDAYFNLGIVLNENNIASKAKENFLKAHEMKPEVPECRFLLAQCYAKLNMPDSVDYWLSRAAEVKIITATDYYLIGTGYGKVANNLGMAIVYLQKAIALSPEVELYYEDLGVAYGLSGRFDEAIATSEKLIQINPKYPAAYSNLSVSYRNKGNIAKAEEYLAKYRELTAPK